MEKYQEWGFLSPKIRRIMKLTLLFTLLCILHISANTYAQTTQVSVNVKNGTFYDVVKQIEKQSEYLFFYNSKDIPNDLPVNLQETKSNITVILDYLVKEYNLSYKINDRHIFLTKNAVVQEQGKRITGTVKDLNGEPIIGGNVVEKGTTNGTITDAEGRFSLNVSSDATLIVSYIGYVASEIPVKDKTSIIITLKEDSKILEEVVVVGYTSTKRELLTGSIATMKMTDDLKNIPSTSPADILAGQLSGVNVSTGDGLPGSQASINIRAKSSWNNQDVLYVIDGVISSATDFNTLSSNEIDNVTVLKDAASAAVYGSRAAGGVIVVTTKRGSYGSGVKIDYSFNTGFSKRGKNVELTDGAQTAELYMRINPSSDPASWAWTADEIEWIKTINGGWGYDLVDAVWQDPQISTHNVSVSGGSEKVKFFAGYSTTKQDGFLENLSYNKHNVRLNVSAKLSENLDVFGSLSLGTSKKTSATGSSVGDIYGLYRWMLGWQPDYPVWTEGGLPIDIGWTANIPAQVRGDAGYIQDNNLRPAMNVSATYKIPYIKGLSATASFSKAYTNSRNKTYQKRYKMYVTKKTGKHMFSIKDEDIIGTTTSSQISKDYLQETSTWGDNWQYNLQLSYDRTFKDVHNLKATLVFEKYELNNGGLSAGIENFPVYNTDQWWATSSDRADSYVARDADYTDQSSGRQSWIGQLFYDYNGKYLFNASYRYDGSMNFSPDNRWGFFPSGSLGWIISKESFFNVEAIDLLKLRASVGMTGNDAIGGWQWQQSYVNGNSSYFGTGSKINSGITYGVLPNEDLTWEKSLTYNVGVDMNFLTNFDLSAEYYYTNTYDILGTRTLAVPPTFSQTLPAENYGEVHAKGFELSLGYSNTFGDFNVHGALVASYANANYIKYDDDKVTYDHQKRVGRSLTAVYGYEFDRILKTEDDLKNFVAANPNYNIHGVIPELGQIVYKDISGPDGTPDGIINEHDMTVLRKNNNPIVMGLTLGAEWKGLSVNAVFNGGLGQEKFVRDLFEGNEWNRMWVDCYYDSWSPENQNASLPKRISAYAGGKTYNYDTDFWLKKANFLRLKNLNVSYTIPQHLYQRIGLDRIQIYFVGTNMFVLSNFNKNYYDPEMGNGFTFPIMRSYNFGINVTI